MTGIKLAADCMVGGLAKWLRLLGLDTVFLARGPFPPDPERILLTRRTQRAHQPRLEGWQKVVRLSANDTFSLLAETLRALNLGREDLRPLSRCSVCNELLRPARPREVHERAPIYVQAAHEEFSLCPGCGRLYWPGTHFQRMMAVIETLPSAG
ncbi:MAG: Mut7-C RNAse domain-containing protein [Thermodesulfobacteriota bacterium]